MYLALDVRLPHPENFVLKLFIFDSKHRSKSIFVVKALAPFNFQLVKQFTSDSSALVTFCHQKISLVLGSCLEQPQPNFEMVVDELAFDKGLFKFI